MGALMDDNPPYRIEYLVVETGKHEADTVTRDDFRRTLPGWVHSVEHGMIADVTVTNRHGVNVTGDWFG